MPAILSIDNCILLNDNCLNHENKLFLDLPDYLKDLDREEPFLGKYYIINDVEVFQVYVISDELL